MLLLLGCNRNSNHAHDDDHHHGEEPKTAQITVWSERHEIFAEHRFVVADTPTKFVTHVTDLKTLEPRRAGPIKFVLRQANDAPVEQVEKEPTRAGIYEAMLKFPKAATGTSASAFRPTTARKLSRCRRSRFSKPSTTPTTARNSKRPKASASSRSSSGRFCRRPSR